MVDCIAGRATRQRYCYLVQESEREKRLRDELALTKVQLLEAQKQLKEKVNKPNYRKTMFAETVLEQKDV